jgi:hypothetical protein
MTMHKSFSEFIRENERGSEHPIKPTTHVPHTPEWTDKAKSFVHEKWKERAAEMGRPEPQHLGGACKFASMFAQHIFGGRLEGNKDHQFNVTPEGKRLDLTAGSPGSENYKHDKRFFGNGEHKQSMEFCKPRVQQWVSEFRKRHNLPS